MEKKILKDVPSAVVELYNKAIEAGSHGNVEYALKLLCDILQDYPTLLPVRDKLREYEKEQAKKCAFPGGLFGFIKNLKIKKAINNDPVKAIGLCEKVLCRNLNNPTVLALLAEAAMNAEAPFIAVGALEQMREFYPNNGANLYDLADCYRANQQFAEALEILRSILEADPNNLDLQKEVREVAALETMQASRRARENRSETRGKSAGIPQAAEAFVIHNSDQAEAMIGLMTEKLKEKDDAEIHKKLAEAYYVLKRYDEAADEVAKAEHMSAVFDIGADRLKEKIKTEQINSWIKDMADHPEQYDDAANQIKQYEQLREDYRLKRAEVRVNNYPNDAQLRYGFGVLCFEHGRVDDAIEQFQISRKNPQRRLSSMFYLGRCFAAKERYDMALEQFEVAYGEMQRSDKERLDVMYFMGEVCMKMGNNEKALTLYKEIYQDDVNFRDVAEKIDKFYKN
ncbi:MAG: tetratricopeptide repeat protein [Victivallaceae bacterium]